MNRAQSSKICGAALIIVLAFLVILSGLVVAYLSRTTTDRQLAHGTFNESRAELYARSALDLVVGDLKQEIVNGSASPAPTPGSTPNIFYVYTPTLDNNVAPIPDGTPTDKSIPNLIKRSVASVPPSPAVSSRASAVNSSTKPSLNGRVITGSRWNKHYLIPRTSTPTGDNDTTPTASFVAPDWVLLTRNGPTAKSWSTALRDSAPGNVDYVVGRYAYAIYDEGGLLDFNVTGYPVPTTSPTNYAFTVGRKGLPGFADISATGLSSDAINDIIGFRSYATVQPGGSFGSFTLDDIQTNRYLTAIFGNTSGFIGVSPALWKNGTDQAFTGRQALLKYWGSGGIGFAVGALQSLGTFSREVTTPSWSPDYDAVNRGGSAGFAYKTNAATTTSTNRDLNNVRVAAAFTRFDGTQAVVGDYLIKRRFPLSRLAWITYKGPSADVYTANSNDPIIIALLNAGVTLSTIQAGTASNIKAAFGLVWDSRAYVQPSGTNAGAGQQWVYTSPTVSNGGGTFNGTAGTAASSIKILDTVGGENREPDFFQLLQACILTGSLGQNTDGGVTGQNTGGAGLVFPDIHMNNKMQHLLSIAAAIIDQADPDSIPTRIRMDVGAASWLALGAESLPCITAMCPVGGVSAENPGQWTTYLLFQLWNPNRSGPTQPPIRLRIDGGIGVFNGNGPVWPSGGGVLSTYVGTDSGKNIAIPSTSTFAGTPFPVTTSKVSASGVAQETFVPVPVPNPAPDPGQKYVGFRLKDFTMPAGTSSQKPELWLQLGATTPFNAILEVDAGGGTWLPYNYFVGINATNSWIANDPIFVRASANKDGNPPPAFTVSPESATKLEYCLMKPDPRSTRLGVFQMDKNGSNTPTSHARIDVPLWEQSNSKYQNGFGGTIGTGANDSVEHVPVSFNLSKPYLPATLSLNSGGNTNNFTSYVDPDGVLRYADAGYSPSNGSGNAETPWDVSHTEYLPIVLNRPLRSAGELGYAFRDLPWRSLDLHTPNSGDAGLIDVFTINDEPAVLAGRIDLNTRQPASVQAVLQKGLWDEYDPTNLIDTTGPSGQCHSDTMAANYADYTSQPRTLSNRSGLVTAINGSVKFVETILKPGNGVAHQNQDAKTRREAVARSIASGGQTRTWNLMIDVIAQSGRYPPSATDLPQFLVEGEKRYWLHIAIDRFTGEVIDQQLEAVYE